jgi:HEAT repeat protein
VITRALTAERVMALLDRPVQDRPYVQFLLRDEAPIASLTEALRNATSPEHAVILANVIGMRFKHAKSAIPALVERLRHSDEAVRYAVADSLGKLRATSSGDALLAALQDEGAPRVRAMLLAGIGAVGATEGMNQLCEALSSGDPNMRQAAAWGLGQLGDPRALQPLSDVASIEDDQWVRDTVLSSLCRLRETGSSDSRLK